MQPRKIKCSREVEVFFSQLRRAINRAPSAEIAPDQIHLVVHAQVLQSVQGEHHHVVRTQPGLVLFRR